MTKRRSPAACSTPIRRRTCATRRWLRSTCTERSTPATTCLRRSRSTRPPATSTTSCSWPRAAARRTRATSSKRRRPCSTRQPHAVLRREAAHARHFGVPAVSPRRSRSAAHRRSTRSRSRSTRRRAYLDDLPTEGNALGVGFRDLETRAEGARAHAAVRHRRPVRRQVLLPRRPGGPPPAARRVVSGRASPSLALPIVRRSARSRARASSSRSSSAIPRGSSPK